MPLTDKDVEDTRNRLRAAEALVKKAEAATDFLELKAIVVDLCRVVAAQAEAQDSGWPD